MESGKGTSSLQIHGKYSKKLYQSISSNQFIHENVFNNAPIRRIAAAMNTSSEVAGSFHKFPFNNQQFHLREIRIIRGGRAIISLDTTSLCRPFVTTMKAMQYSEGFPAHPMEDFQNHYILVFDLTSVALSRI